MKLLRFHGDRGTVTGALTTRGICDLGPAFDDFATALMPERRTEAARAASAASAVPVDSIRWATPLAPGARLFCVGLNYRDHVTETGRETPAQPSVFLRTHESVVPNGTPMQRPAASLHYDYEGELTVVIGVEARSVKESDALSHVAGYTIVNDGSLRDYQKFSVTAGKNFDASGACGPWVVTSDEIPDPSRLTVRTRLNGLEVQHAETDRLIYSIPFLIAYLSKITALHPGDLIATGTPSGVGSRRNPPLWMKPGDEVEVEISSIGNLKNRIVDA